MRASHLVLTVACSLLPASAAEARERWRIGGGLTLSHFEQQVKSEVGGRRGERLVEDSEVGLLVAGSYRVWRSISAGIFTQLDLGNRRAGELAGFDASGAAVVDPAVGGVYAELWLGPLVRGEWRRLFLEVGYGLIGIRDDEGRADLPASDGDTDGAFRTLPSVAWTFGLGGSVSLGTRLDLELRLEYRIRYYDRRGGDALADDVVHGTQNLTPFVGLAWRP